MHGHLYTRSNDWCPPCAPYAQNMCKLEFKAELIVTTGHVWLLGVRVKLPALERARHARKVPAMRVGLLGQFQTLAAAAVMLAIPEPG